MNEADAKDKKDTQSLKSSSQANEDCVVWRVAEAAAGDKNNDRITNCNICTANGWPHEPIDFEKIAGRILADGTREAAGWWLKNYYTGQPHKHKQGRRC
jgi:hypothetical protein